MYTYTAVVATEFPDSNGNQFHSDVFKKIIEDNPTVPVTINFNKEPIGNAKDFFLTENKELFCRLDINIKHLDELNLFAVPGGFSYIQDLEKLNDGKINLIKKYNLTEISITNHPADSKLSNIKSDHTEVSDGKQN